MISYKTFLIKAVVWYTATLLLSFALVFSLMDSYFWKYATYSLLGVASTFALSKTIPSLTPLSLLRALQLSENAGRCLELSIIGLSIAALLAKLKGVDMPFQYLLAINLGSTLSELHDIQTGGRGHNGKRRHG